MGKLRIEPKVKPPITDEEYAYYKSLLQEGRRAAADHFVYYDLEPGENAAKVRKALRYVAAEEGIPLQIRRVRGSNVLNLQFPESGGKGAARRRLSAAEAHGLILETLRKADRPMARGEILAATGISPASWTVRLQELLEKGLIRRHGKGRESTYSLA